jgi:tetratricopeptide (TPR) repeat protein
MFTGALRFKRTLALSAALAAGCFIGSPAAGAAEGANIEPAPQVHASPSCPGPSDLDSTLGQASSLMQQSRFQDAAGLLQPLSNSHCDPRISLLLAAALESEGNEPQATSVLEHAHGVWPANNSVAASLARIYLGSHENEKASKALLHFHATAQTPEQEMEMAVVVYLAAHQLVDAEKVAREDYKVYPSVHSLLLLANALQLQGRYPDVNRILGARRAQYADSPEFSVTLAESEFDASIFPAARDDLQHAISLNPQIYQAHYLLGNVLARTRNDDAAVAEYRLAIHLSPGQPRTYYQLAMVLRDKQDEAGEQQALQDAVTADSQYAPAQSELGSVLLENGHPADAVTHLLIAIQSNPRSEKAYFLLARAYAALGEREKSQEMVKRLQAVREENRPGPMNKGGVNHPGGSSSQDQATSR